MNNTTLLWVWLAEALGADNGNGVRLLHALQTPAAIYSADRNTLSALSFLSPKELDRLCDKSLAAAQWILDTAANEQIGILCYDMPLYPERLRRIQNPPLVLYYRGNFKMLSDKLAIAVVGTREMSESGMKTTYRIAYELAAVGAVVVSGMARGIDGTSHRAALDAGGYTIAVLGSAINVCYPPEHKALYDTIIKRGCVLSEYAPQTKTQRWFFPQRNRIISGLCQGTLITDAAEGSGALITAGYSQVQGRDTFALPGDPNDPLREGTNELIKNEAHPVTKTADILSHYDRLYKTLHTERLFDKSTYRGYDESGERHSYQTAPSFTEAPEQEELREERYELDKELRVRTHIAKSDNRRTQITRQVKEDATSAALTLGDLIGPSKETTKPTQKRTEKKATPMMLGLKNLFAKPETPLVTADEEIEDIPAYTPVEIGALSDALQRKPHKSAPSSDIACETDASDITDALPADISEEDARLLSVLSEKKTVDELCSLGFSMSDILTSLTMLEIDGHVKALPGGYFIKNKKKP